MHLIRTLVKELEHNRKWIKAILSSIDHLAILVSLDEEASENLIDLLIKDEEIEKTVCKAVKEVLGNGVVAYKIDVKPDGSTIRFLLSNRS